MILTLVALGCGDGSGAGQTTSAASGVRSAAPPATSARASAAPSASASSSASAHSSAQAPEAPAPNVVQEDVRTALTWRPDTRAIIAARGDKVAILAVPGGRATPLADVGGPVEAVAVSPKGDRVAVVTKARVVKIFDGRSGAFVAELPETIPDDEVNALVFSPDGKLFAGSGYTSARVWNIERKQKICDVSEIHSFDLAFTPDQGSLVVTGVGAMGRYELPSCEKKAENHADTTGTFGSWVAPDGLHIAAAGGAGHDLQLFGGRDLHSIDTLAKSAGCTDHVAARFSRDGKVLFGLGGTSWVRSFRLESKKTIGAYDIPRPEEVSFVVPFDDGERAIVVRNDKAEVVNVKDKSVAFSFGLEGATSLEISWDMSRLLGSTPDKAVIWDTATGKVLETLSLP